MGKTHGVRKLINPAPKAKPILMIINSFIFAFHLLGKYNILMIIKYIGFIITLLWSYSFIKLQSLFKKGSGFLITLFVSNISWFTFIAACIYGFKNFEFYYVLLAIGLTIALVHLLFGRISLFINSKFQNKQNLVRIKTFIEYLIIALILYFIFN